MDAEWRIDVRKSATRPPQWARGRLASVGEDARRRAREVFVWRGGGGRQRSAGSAAADLTLWRTRAGQSGPRYTIDRDHPAVTALSLVVGAEALEGLLSALELTVPVERIWLDISETGGPGTPDPNRVDVAALAGPLAVLVSRVQDGGGSEAGLDGLLLSLGVDTPALRHAVIAELRQV